MLSSLDVGTSKPAGTDSASPIAGADEVRLSRSKSTSPARTAGPSAATLHAEVRTSHTRPILPLYSDALAGVVLNPSHVTVACAYSR